MFKSITRWTHLTVALPAISQHFFSLSVASVGFTCCTEPYSPQPLPTAVTRTIIPTFSAYRAQKCATARPLLTVRSSQCVNLPSLAFSSTVLATMFSSSIKKEKILNAEVFGYTSVCSEKTTSFSLSAVRVSVCVFSSLLVGIRVNFTHIKVVEDKTGCHRLACNVSWAWFLLWAGSAALHFYSNPPKTIPCVIWLRNLPPDAENLQVLEAPMYANRGLPFFFLQWILSSRTPGYYQLYITTAGVG